MPTFAEIAAADLDRARRAQSEIEARRHDLIRPSPDPSDLGDLHARYDQAYASVGAPGAPAPLPGESRFSYRRRLAGGLQHLSPEWRGADLYRLGRDVLDAAEPAILTAVVAAVADRTRGDHRGGLREIQSTTAAGHRITEFAGNPLDWMRTFMSPAQTVRRFKNPYTGDSLRPARRSL